MRFVKFIGKVLVFLVVVLWFMAATYFHLSIVNDTGKPVVVERVMLGILPVSKQPVLLDTKEDVHFSPFKFSDSPTLLMETIGESGVKSRASCVLDAGGSDSCRVYLLSNGKLDCSECYH